MIERILKNTAITCAVICTLLILGCIFWWSIDGFTKGLVGQGMFSLILGFMCTALACGLGWFAILTNKDDK